MAEPQTAAVSAGQELLPIIAQLETGGHDDPDTARSHAGAVGRYQIMPGTARLYGFEAERLTEPDYNKQVAGTILNDLWRRYHGDASAVLIAYNAGPKTANEWLTSGRKGALPAETAGYLDKAAKLMTGGNLQRDVPILAMDDVPGDPVSLPRSNGVAPGRALIQKALDAGYSAQDVLQWKAKKTQDALGAGYKPDEIDAYFGESPPQLADAERLIKNNLSQVPADQVQKIAANPLDAMRAGWGTSDIGLVAQGGMPDMTMPEAASTSMRVAAAAGQFAGDLPATLGGFFLGSSAGAAVGAPAGPVGAGAGALVGGGFGAAAVPQAIREALVMGYRRGEIHSFSDFAGVMGGATARTLKAGLAGAVTAPLGVFAGKAVGGAAARLAGAETIEIAGAGSNKFLPYVVHNDVSRLVGTGADLATQTAVYGSVSAAMDGRMPDKSDFITGGMFALGFHIGARVVGGRQRPTAAGEAAAEGMEEVFRTTGHTPWEAAQAAHNDPVLRQELLTIDVNGEHVQPTWQANAKDEPPPFVKPEPLKLNGPEKADENEFSGNLQVLHASSQKGLQAFKNPAKVDPNHRYDGGGENSAAFGPYTYFDESGNWVDGSMARGINTKGGVYGARLDFKKAFILTPDSIQAAREAAGISKDAPAVGGAELARRLKARGYDGIIVRGFSDFENQLHTEVGDELTAKAFRQEHPDDPASPAFPRGTFPKAEAMHDAEYQKHTDEGREWNRQYIGAPLTPFHAFEYEIAARGLALDAAQDQIISLEPQKNATLVRKYKPEEIAKFQADAEAKKAEGGGGNKPPVPPRRGPPPGQPENPQRQPPQLDGLMLNEIASEFIGGEQPDRALDAARMYRQWVSELGPARAIDKLLIARGLDTTRKLGVEDMFRQTYASDSRLGYFLQYGGIKLDIDARNNVVFAHDNVMPFKAIAKQVQTNGGNLSDWTNWMVAQRANDKETQGFETGHPLTPMQRGQLIAIGQSKYRGPTTRLQALLDNVLNYTRDSGVFSQTQVDAMRRDNPFYITMRRLMGDEKTIPPIRSGRNFRVMEPVSRFEGDERQIMNPIVALVDNMHTMIRMADRNRAIGSVIALAERHGVLEDLGLKQLSAPEVKATIAEPGSNIFKAYNLDPEASPETYQAFLAQRSNRYGGMGKDKFMFIRDGEVEVWKASDPALAELLRGAESPGEANAAMQLATAVAKMNRAGIINAADFPVRNVLRDQLTTYVLDPNSPPPFLTWLKGAFEVFGQGEMYKAWLRNGGGGSALVEMDKAYFHRSLAEILEDTGITARLWNTVRHPIEAAQMVQEKLDASSRVGYTGNLSETRPDIEPVKAATMSRKAYIDFVEKGTLAFMQGWAKATPFLRPSILGLKQAGEAIAGNPAGTLLKAFLAIQLPTMVLYALNYIQDESGEIPEDRQFKNLPRWQRDGYYITPEIGGVRVRLPFPQVVGQVFGGMTNRALDHFVRQDPEAFKQWSHMIASAVIPPMIPSIVLPPIEWFANRSTFTGKPIVPEGLQDATGPMQYTSATTEPAKKLSRAIKLIGPDVSPIMIENTVREWMGSLGMEALRALNVSMMGFNKKPWEITDLPFVQSFFVRNPGMNAQPIQEFYDVRDEFVAARRDLSLAMKGQVKGTSSEDELQRAVDQMLPPGPLAAQIKYLQTMHTLVQAIENKPLISDNDVAEGKDGMTADDKRQQTDTIVSNMIVTSKAAVTNARAIMKTMKEAARGRQ